MQSWAEATSLVSLPGWILLFRQLAILRECRVGARVYQVSGTGRGKREKSVHAEAESD